MSMEINGISSVTPIYSNQDNTDISVKKPEERTVEKVQDNAGVAYEKGTAEESGLYSKMKMNKADRTAIAEQMKANMEENKRQLMALVQKTLSGQVGAYGKANEDSFWKTLAGGKYTVDAATKAQAQKDIGEDGYWGVKQTSQRLFDFASALAGDDVDKMKDMQKAMEKGFKLATKAWGRELPKISQDTLDAANKLFENYYKFKEQEKNAAEIDFKHFS